MTRPTVLTLAGGLALAWLAAPAPARACKCAVPPALEARATAAAVFEGRVSAVEELPAAGTADGDSRQVTLAVVRVWKGLENSETVRVTTRGSSASCGYMFEPNVSYLVYAGGSTAKLEVSGCSRTRALSDAGDDLALLGAGITPVTVTADSPPAAPPKATPKTGGCGSVKAAAQASAPLALLPATGLVLGARRRKGAR